MQQCAYPHVGMHMTPPPPGAAMHKSPLQPCACPKRAPACMCLLHANVHVQLRPCAAICKRAWPLPLAATHVPPPTHTHTHTPASDGHVHVPMRSRALMPKRPCFPKRQQACAPHVATHVWVVRPRSAIGANTEHL
eukprot:366052-Chlamydomonas_euryale.AAC.6